MPKEIDMFKCTDAQIEDLSTAIIQRAAEDYGMAYMGMMIGDREPTSVMRELEEFFHSDYYELLTTVDSDYILTRIKIRELEKAINAYQDFMSRTRRRSLTICLPQSGAKPSVAYPIPPHLLGDFIDLMHKQIDELSAELSNLKKSQTNPSVETVRLCEDIFPKRIYPRASEVWKVINGRRGKIVVWADGKKTQIKEGDDLGKALKNRYAQVYQRREDELSLYDIRDSTFMEWLDITYRFGIPKEIIPIMTDPNLPDSKDIKEIKEYLISKGHDKKVVKSLVKTFSKEIRKSEKEG